MYLNYLKQKKVVTFFTQGGGVQKSFNGIEPGYPGATSGIDIDTKFFNNSDVKIHS